MNLRATIANTLWGATNLPSHRRFCRSLDEPERAQHERLQACLEHNQHTAFARAHQLGPGCSYEEFARRMPLTDYEGLRPWIDRIRQGEANVLTRDRVTRLVPTSGSSGGRKLIPFTRALQAEFSAGIGPWLVDLALRDPSLAGGPAYWSVSPIVDHPEEEESAVPIGFDSDTAYLGGTTRRLANAVMAVPDEFREIQDVEAFRYATLLCLLRARDLRLISVWHPSFLTLLLDSLPANWGDLEADIRRGGCRRADEFPAAVRDCLRLAPLPGRAAELRRVDLQRPEMIWPDLKLISCWGDGAAGVAADCLQRSFPNTPVQPKGLLATEACMTIPFSGRHPVAVRSHFLEFADEAGKIRRVHELEPDQTYETIVTTSGGLWRYRLGDRVQVNGFMGRTPSLRFLGRSGNVSDLRGEKLSESFVVQVLQERLIAAGAKPRFVLFAPDQDALGARYTLYAEGALPRRFAAGLDHALRQNPHYAYCRDLGQLLPVRVFAISRHGPEKFISRELTAGVRLGNLKPAILSRSVGWSSVFEGEYVHEDDP